MMLFIQQQYARSRARARGRARTSSSARRTARSASSCRSPGSTGRSSRRSTSAARSATTSGPSTSRTSPRTAASLRARLRAPAARACRWSSSNRRTGRWPGRCSPTSTSSTRPGRRTRPQPITFVVIPEYVARHWWERILYNQAAKRLRTVLLGPAAHGRRQRAVPARGSGAVRGGAGGTASAIGRRMPGDRGRSGPPADRPAGDARPQSPRPSVHHRAARGGPYRRRWYRDQPCPMPITPVFSRAVVALNGGPSDARIVRLVAELARPSQGRAHRRPCRRDRLDAAARRRHRRPVARRSSASSTWPRRSPRSPRCGSSRSCSRPATSGRRSSTRPPSAAPTCSSWACPIASGSAANSPSAGPSRTSCRTHRARSGSCATRSPRSPQ